MGLSSKQVSSDGHEWNHQDLLEGEKPSSLKRQSSNQQQQQQQQQSELLKCPRCDSINTKFCYYNNYNKSQPRYFCKACKRHWTKGGTLRNVPVGGGRKNKRLKTYNAANKTAAKTTVATLFSGISCNNNITIQPRQPRLDLPLTETKGGDKNISAAFYQTLGEQSQNPLPENPIIFNSKASNDGNNGIFLGSTVSPIQSDEDLQFPYSNLGIFESNPCSISSNQSPNIYNNYTQDQANGFEETGMNSLDTSISSSSMSDHQTWEILTESGIMDLSSNWGWDDFDQFVSVEADLTIPSDDAEIKP